MLEMPKLPPLAIVAVAVGALVAVAVVANDGAQPPDAIPTGYGSFQPIVGCLEELPSPVEAALPAGLPMPSGTYASRTYDAPAAGIDVVTYTVPTSLDAFVEHVLADWPGGDWQLGRGERETGEAESVFFSSDRSRYGQFRARAVYCDPNAVEVTLTLGSQTESPSPKGS